MAEFPSRASVGRLCDLGVGHVVIRRDAIQAEETRSYLQLDPRIRPAFADDRARIDIYRLDAGGFQPVAGGHDSP